MPNAARDSLLPGKQGTDYHFVRYGDKVYVVYRVKLPNGRTVNTTWRVEKDDYKALGIDAGRVNRIGRAQWKNLNIFGSSSEIVGGDQGAHPFQRYIKDLRERYGNVSWFDNKEFMSTMLMGWAEGWSATELEQAVKQTKWYQKRTDRQRQWELEFTREERRRELDVTKTRIMDMLDEEYGPSVDWRKYIKPKDLKSWTERIASGKFGDPSEGFEVWLRRQREAAAKIEGTNAWIQRQKELEEQRGFMNRPEDVFAQIKQEAFEWLGPRGLPDKRTLTRWSEDLVSELKSDGDWQKFLQNQARSLYPYLGENERWQDRASAYKRILEENWGQPVDWDEGLLYKIGKTGTDGKFTGEALGYDEFETLARSRPRFWSGPVAKEEGFELFNFLNQTFNGVS